MIQLPKKIKTKHCVINVKYTGNECFRFAILSEIIRSNDPRAYEDFESSYSFDCISFPTPQKDITRFETVNNVSVNVYGLDRKNQLYPLRISKKYDYDKDFDILYIQNEENSHYC